MPDANHDGFECPNCGEDVPAGALACPACGADDETGWSEDTMYDGLDLPIDHGGGYGEPEDEIGSSVKQYVTVGVVLLMLALMVLFAIF